MPGDGGVDLHLDAGLAQVAEPRSAASNEPGSARKASCVAASAPSMLMLTPGSRISDLAGDLRRDQGSVGRHRDEGPCPTAWRATVKGPGVRRLAQEDQDRPARARDAFDQGEGFLRGEIVAHPLPGNLQPPAVDALQVTPCRGLPKTRRSMGRSALAGARSDGPPSILPFPLYRRWHRRQSPGARRRIA